MMLRAVATRGSVGGEMAATYNDEHPNFDPAQAIADADKISAPGLTDEQARELANRWVVSRHLTDTSGRIFDEAERDALFAWVRARMEREVEARSRRQLAWDELEDNDREALAYTVMLELAGDFINDQHGEHGLAWALCEAAGWPS